MAKVIQNEHNDIVEPWWVKGRIVFIGLGMGLLWWVLTAAMRQYVVEPIACRDLSTAAACVNSIGVAGSIATILVAVVGILILIRNFQPRPIIIGAASAVLLWGLGALLAGLNGYEAILWSVLLYAASYLLFWMVARIRLFGVSIAVAVVIVLVIRLVLAL